MTINSDVIRSIVGSVIFKMGTAMVSFFSVPLLLNALGTNDYGLWVTLTALITWLNLFDFGAGYSLKNKVTESLIHQNKQELHVYIAGTLQFYVFSTAAILIVFIICLFSINVFKSHVSLSLLIYLPVIVSFPLTLGHFIIQGLKKFNLFNGLLLTQSAVWLMFLLIFDQKIFEADLETIALIYSILYGIEDLKF
jgi:O-antigen/teichoic acid export membrane protein